MKNHISRLFIILFVAFFVKKAYSQEIKNEDQYSKKWYVFKLNNEQSEFIFKNGLASVDSSYFSNLIDSLKSEDDFDKLKYVGNFLIGDISTNRLNINFLSNAPFDIQPLNNSRDLRLVLINRNAEFIKDAEVYLGRTKIAYNNVQNCYFKPKFLKGAKFVKVKYKDQIYFFDISNRGKSRITRFVYRATFGNPLGYLTRPFKDFYHTFKSGYTVGSIRKIQDFFSDPRYYFESKSNRKSYNESFKYSAFTFFNKPMYFPGDTLKYKIVVLDKKGRAIYDKPLKLALNSYFNKYTKSIGFLNSYKSGFYEGEVCLSDTFQLKLDKEYQLIYEGKDEINFVNNDFYYGDYVLNGKDVTLKCPQKVTIGKDSLLLEFDVKDERGLFAAGFDANFKIKYDKILDFPAFEFHETPLLYQNFIKLSDLGKGSFAVPDSIFPDGNYKVKVFAEFKDFSNNVFRDECIIGLSNRQLDANIFLRNDTVFVFSDLGSNEKFSLNYFDSFLKKHIEKEIQLPYYELINHNVKNYKLIYKDQEITSLEIKDDEFSFTGSRNLNSLNFQIDNPNKLPFWIDVFHKNRLIKRISGNESLEKQIITKSKKYYFVNVCYMFDNKVFSENFKFDLHDKQLNVTVKTNHLVSPGEVIPLEIFVKDIKGKPAKNVDLTIKSITKKFGEQKAKPIKDYNTVYKNRKFYNRVNFNSIKSEEGEVLLKRELKSQIKELNSNLYFNTIYADSALKILPQRSKNNITQFAVFVNENGVNKDVYFVYINNEPVYIKLGGQGQPYSFLLEDWGVKNLKIRTSDKLIEIDSVAFIKNKKNLLYIDPSIPDTKVRVRHMESELSKDELKTLNKYCMPLSKSYSNSFSSINQSGRYFWVKNQNFIAPITLRPATFKTEGSFELNFEPEEGYAVEFHPQKVKLKYLNPIEKFLLVDNKFIPEVNFQEEILSKHEIDSLYLHSEKAKKVRPLYGKFEGQTKEGNGEMSIFNYDSKEFKSNFCYFIFNNDEPSFINFSPNVSQLYKDLVPGQYHVYILKNDKSYFRSDTFTVFKNSLTLLNFSDKNVNLKKPDSLSLKLWKIINENQYTPNNAAAKSKVVYYENTNRYAGYGQVSGVVLDEDGSAIPGVIINIKGTSSGTSTDIDGHYLLNVPSNAILIFSFVGFATKEVFVNNKRNIDVQLEQESSMLQEVVVVGYGIQKRSSVSGAVSYVDMGQMLAGKAAGVSVSDNFKPLVLVDGVPIKNADLEKLLEEFDLNEVLGSETGKVLYGKDGENGVINLLSRKKGGVGNQENEFKIRKNFKDYAFWIPKLTTDINGKATTIVKMPDDLTQWESNVYAFGDNGKNGQKSFSIKSFISHTSELSIPRFLIKADSVRVFGQTKNFSTDSMKVDSKIYINDSLIYNTSRLFLSSLNDSAMFSAFSKSDTIKVNYQTLSDKNSFDGEERKIPVYPKGTVENIGEFKFFENKFKGTFSIENSENEVEIRIFDSFTDIALDEIDKIGNYRYLCNEQMSSKLLSLLQKKVIFEKQKKAFGEEKQIEWLIAKIKSNTNDEGAWSWWNKGKTEDWITEHIVQTFLLAQKMGYIIEFDISAFLKRRMYEYPKLRTSEKLRFLKIAKNSSFDLDYNKYLNEVEKQNDLALSERLDIEKLKFRILNKADVSKFNLFIKTTLLGGVYLEDTTNLPFLNTEILTLNYLTFLKEADSSNSNIKNIYKYFLEKRLTGGWGNTYFSSKLINEIVKNDLLSFSSNTYNITGDSNLLYEVKSFPFYKKIKGFSKIEIESQNNQPGFISFSERISNENPEPVSKDLIINTKFEDNDNLRLKSGKIYKLKVEVNVRKEANFVLVEVPIPAGCTYFQDAKIQNVVNYEQFKDKTSLYFDKLTVGLHVFEIELVAQFPGKYTLNPAKAELMYFPTVFGRNSVKTVSIE